MKAYLEACKACKTVAVGLDLFSSCPDTITHELCDLSKLLNLDVTQFLYLSTGEKNST